jgi:hypothetical protein
MGPTLQEDAVGEKTRDGCSGPFSFWWEVWRTGAARGDRNDGPKNLISRVIVPLNSIGVAASTMAGAKPYA